MKLGQQITRIALGVPFIWLGYDAVAAPGARVQHAAKLGIPRPEDAVRLNGAAMMAGGIGLIVGVRPRAAALGLFLTMIPTTLAGHSFWQDTDPQLRKNNRIQFLKNLGLSGGLLGVAFTPEVKASPSGCG
jgi:putative oxidoreductase